MAQIAFEQKTSFFLLALGLILFVVSFAAPSWFSGPEGKNDPDGNNPMFRYLGLWRDCASVPIKPVGYVCSAHKPPDWTKGPQILESIALAVAVVAAGVSVLMMFRTGKFGSSLAALLALYAGILGICGAAEFHIKAMDMFFTTKLSSDYCFYLNIIGDVSMLLSGLLLLNYSFRMPRPGYDTLQ